MSVAWPRWATLRAEDIRAEIPPHERGPWRDNLNCRQSTPIPDVLPAGPHPAEAPYFFHCVAHLEAIRRTHGAAKPLPSRDQGLCISCRQPADRLPVTMGAAVVCAKAERDNSTVARLSTARYCGNCKPVRKPPCRGRTCRDTPDRQRTQPAGCCSITKNGKRLHCNRCCLASQLRKRQREKSAKASKMGQASAAARRKRAGERRQDVQQLRRSGMDEITMAHLLGVSAETVRKDIRNIQRPTQAARAANSAAAEQRRRTIAQLHTQGDTPDEIATKMRVTPGTVRRNLKLLRVTGTTADKRRKSP